MITEENEHLEVEEHDRYVEDEDEEIPSGDLFMITICSPSGRLLEYFII
jgi:hypothetical protein